MWQEEENELDALQSAKELEEEKKRAKEQQAKMVWFYLFFCSFIKLYSHPRKFCIMSHIMLAGWYRPGYLYDCHNAGHLRCCLCEGNPPTMQWVVTRSPHCVHKLSLFNFKKLKVSHKIWTGGQELFGLGIVLCNDIMMWCGVGGIPSWCDLVNSD